MLVTHAVSHEQDLQTPMPAGENIAPREQQGRKEQSLLAGHEGPLLPGCLQSPQGCGERDKTAPWLHASHQVCHTSPGVPAAQDHCLSGQAGLSSSAALQPWRGAPASGYHQGLDACRVTCQQPSTSQGAPWFLSVPTDVSQTTDTTVHSLWGGRQLLQSRCGFYAGWGTERW